MKRPNGRLSRLKQACGRIVRSQLKLRSYLQSCVGSKREAVHALYARGQDSRLLMGYVPDYSSHRKWMLGTRYSTRCPKIAWTNGFRAIVGFQGWDKGTPSNLTLVVVHTRLRRSRASSDRRVGGDKAQAVPKAGERGAARRLAVARHQTVRGYGPRVRRDRLSPRARGTRILTRVRNRSDSS